MTMEDRRREIESAIMPDADKLIVRMEATVEVEGPTGIAQMGCGELLERVLDLRDVATDFPHDAVISRRLRQQYARTGKRLHYAADTQGCITRNERHSLNRTVEMISTVLGDNRVFDEAQRYERQARNAFEGSVAGMGPG